MKPHLGGLWRDREFLKLWGSETVSLFGSAITTLALPLTAVTLLHATPAQMGLLGAATFAPFLLLTLPLGVWVDRTRRRPLLVAANFARAVLLALVPFGTALGWLSIGGLYPIAFLVGAFDALFHLAYAAYLPSLVGQDHLLEGNSKLQASASTAEIAGPGLAGALVGLIGAPFAVALDAASFLLGALGIGVIRRPEPRPTRPGTPVKLVREVRAGLQLVFGHPLLRPMALEAATFNGCAQAAGTLLVLYATRDLHLSPGLIGLIFAMGGVGALIGSLLAGPMATRWGLGRALVGMAALACLPSLLVPLASGARPQVVATLMLASLLGGAGVAASSVHFLSLRQALTPPALLGRMTASYRTLTYGVLPLGALLFGFLAQALSIRAALWVGAAGVSLAWLWVRCSPVWLVRSLPESPAHPNPVVEPDTTVPAGQGAG